MPRLPDFVPRVGQQNPQTPGYSAPRVAPVQDATGGQMADLGQALVQGGSAALRISDYIDDVAATTAYNTFDAELSKLESGYGQMQGKTAMDAYKGTLDSATALRRKFEESLDSERQRQLFASRAGVRFADGEIRLGAHGARQTQVAKIGALEAGSSGAFTNYEKTMAFARSVPDENARADQEAVAMSYLQAGLKQKLEASVLRGEPPEMQEAIRVGTLDKVHGGMLDVLLRDYPKGAASYLQRFQGEMSEGTRSVASQRLRVLNDNETANALLTEPEMAAKPLPEKLTALKERLAAGKIDVAAHDLARKRAVDDEVIARAAKHNYEADLLDKAKAALDANQGRDPASVLDSATVVQLKNTGLWDDVEHHAVHGAVLRPEGVNLLMGYHANPELLRGVSQGQVANAIAPVMDTQHKLMVMKLWADVNGTQGGRSGNAASVPQSTLQDDGSFLIEMAQKAKVLPPGVPKTEGSEKVQNTAPYIDFVRRLEKDTNALEAKLKRKATRDEISTVVDTYNRTQAEVGGRMVSVFLVPPEEGVNGVVTANGVRVKVSEVLADKTNPYGGIDPNYAAMVQDWNAKARGTGVPPRDPDNPVDVAYVLASTRAVQQARDESRAGARAADISQKRVTQMRAQAQEMEVLRDLLLRGVAPGDPEWMRYTDPERWESERETRERNKARAANPWK